MKFLIWIPFIAIWLFIGFLILLAAVKLKKFEGFDAWDDELALIFLLVGPMAILTLFPTLGEHLTQYLRETFLND